MTEKEAKEETPEVKELTEEEIKNLSFHYSNDQDEQACYRDGARECKILIDEYWKQELAKKDKEIGELKEQLDLSKATRFELIEKGVGRLIVKNELSSVELSFQDEGRTLKVFID